MWSETLGYRDFRPPYLENFFEDVALRVPLAGYEDLLDLGCGAGEVALGFAPFVGSLTGIDLERPMLDEAQRRADKSGQSIRLIHAPVEKAPEDLGPFNVITIGKAIWFMHTPATLIRIGRWLLPNGSVIVCLPQDANIGHAPWCDEFKRVQRRWSRIDLEPLIRLSPQAFFAGTDFAAVDQVNTFGERAVDLEHLVNRALGYPNTSRAILGADADRMIDELRSTLDPYFRDGPLVERHCTSGMIFRRRSSLRLRFPR